MAEPRGDFSTIKGEKFQMASMLDRALKNFEFQLRHGAVKSRHSGAGGSVFRLVLIHNISAQRGSYGFDIGGSRPTKSNYWGVKTYDFALFCPFFLGFLQWQC